MINTSSGALTEEEKIEIELSKAARLYRSKIQSLDSIGIAPPGEMTTIVAPKGMGKSTLVRTILTGAAANNVKTLVILSEEKIVRYKESICDGFYLSFDKKYADEKLSNLTYTTMIDWEKEDKTTDSFFSFLEFEVRDNGVQLIVFDNFNTSFLNDLPIMKQSEAATDLRKLAGFYNISMLCVFHTTKGIDIHDRMIDGENVRGSATSTNTAGYNLIMTTYFRLNPPRSVLHIDKARYHPKVNKTYWELIYDERIGIFSHDKQLKALQADQIRKQAKDME